DGAGRGGRHPIVGSGRGEDGSGRGERRAGGDISDRGCADRGRGGSRQELIAGSRRAAASGPGRFGAESAQRRELIRGSVAGRGKGLTPALWGGAEGRGGHRPLPRGAPARG